MTGTRPSIGASKDELDTPALCLDLDLLESNIRQVARTCAENGVGWRPHMKGHKVPAIAHLQLKAGALGITCAKLGEAEVMAEGGIRDLLIANLIVGPQKMRRLVALCRIADPIVCIDHIEQARPLAQAMREADLSCRVIIEIDIGLQRVGVLPGEPAMVLARQLDALDGIELAGIMGYEGHLLTIPDPQEKQRRIHEALSILAETRQELLREGLPCPIVSCAGTGSFQHSVRVPGITEVQAGGAIYMDAFYRHKCQVADLGYAMTVLATVVSRPAPDRAIIDAGRKTMNIEVHVPLVRGREDIRVLRLSAEHGQLELEPSAEDLRIGQRLELIPGYGDLTTALHDEFYGFRNGRLEVIWPVAARGRIR